MFESSRAHQNPASPPESGHLAGFFAKRLAAVEVDQGSPGMGVRRGEIRDYVDLETAVRTVPEA